MSLRTPLRPPLHQSCTSYMVNSSLRLHHRSSPHHSQSCQCIGKRRSCTCMVPGGSSIVWLVHLQQAQGYSDLTGRRMPQEQSTSWWYVQRPVCEDSCHGSYLCIHSALGTGLSLRRMGAAVLVMISIAPGGANVRQRCENVSVQAACPAS